LFYQNDEVYEKIILLEYIKMPQTIVLNKNNIDNTSTNNTLTYKFPNSVTFKNNSIAVNSLTMYYSWTNINSSPLTNNTFSYTWENATNTQTTYSITIPDGLYEVSDLNSYLQYKFIANGHYLVNSSSQNVYYAEFLINPTTYSVNIVTYPFPTSLPSGYTNPASVAFPASKFNPVITLPANFNNILGYTAGYATARNLGVGTTLTYSSSTTPQVQPNPVIFLTCSGISNKYATPSTILHSTTPTVALGQIIEDKPNEKSYAKLTDGTYNQLTFKFLGSDLTPITILDPAITLMLSIKENSENE